LKKATDNEIYKYEIPKAWVAIIWATGSILGVTKMVAMKFTRKYGRPRLKVAVLKPRPYP
jgi:hypothetical protein